VLSVPMILPWTCMQTVLPMNPVTEIAHITTLLPCSCQQIWKNYGDFKPLFSAFALRNEKSRKMELITEPLILPPLSLGLSYLL